MFIQLRTCNTEITRINHIKASFQDLGLVVLHYQGVLSHWHHQDMDGSMVDMCATSKRVRLKRGNERKLKLGGRSDDGRGDCKGSNASRIWTIYTEPSAIPK